MNLSDSPVVNRGKTRRRISCALLTVALILAIICVVRSSNFTGFIGRLQGKKTVQDRLSQYGATARVRLADDFQQSGAAYPPRRLVLVGLKAERALQVYAASHDEDFKCVKSYPILAASGKLGPKLEEGDLQVPEGVYRVVFLNPNSAYHLSLRLDYPNDFDRAMAKKDGRTHLGGDIMIHGARCSIGCLAMGDTAAEDLFVLAADTGIESIKVILSPVDFRHGKLPSVGRPLPEWSPRLYQIISRELSRLPETGQVP